MSFEDILDGKTNKKPDKKITDPKLLKHLNRKATATQRTEPNVTLVKVVKDVPHKTISLVIDGKKKKPAPTLMEVFLCNVCGNNFNWTQQKALLGKPPHCPSCD